MIQRGGDVVIRMLANVQQETIKPLIQATIAPGTCVYTDEYDIYSRLVQWGSGLKVENPLAGMILPICCQFAIYARMSSPDLGDFGSMAVSLSEVMQLGGYTRILDGHL
jgi:hypothetical protein